MKQARLQRNNYIVSAMAGQGGIMPLTGFCVYGRDALPLVHPFFIVEVTYG